MKGIIKSFLFLLLIMFFSCEEQGLFIKCDECLDSDPFTAELELKLDVNYKTGETLVNIYEGNLEDGILYKTRVVTGKKAMIPVLLNRKYTVTATYYIEDVQGSYCIVVDTANPRVKFDESQCDYPCYFVYDRVVDLTMK
ncbi:MAG: hypothetical protein MUF36_09870 [Bacteroidales bacterium]|jgi:hypothetical protein|nr:hypothetical protein [Bacteroidales bacterium]